MQLMIHIVRAVNKKNWLWFLLFSYKESRNPLSIHFTAWKMSKYGLISGPHFPAFGLNTERYVVSFQIQSECGKIWARNNYVFGHFLRSAWSLIFLQICCYFELVRDILQLPEKMQCKIMKYLVFRDHKKK